MGSGLVQVRLIASEELSTPPFLNLSVGGAQALFVDLTAVGSKEYTGAVSVTSSTRSGPISASFSAYDSAGNRGTTATVEPSVSFDTAGPRVIGVSPVSLVGESTYETLPQVDSIKNIPAAPATSVSRWWKFTLDEDPAPGLPPTFTATLSTHLSSVVTVTSNDAWDSDPRTWLVQTTLPHLPQLVDFTKLQ